MNLAISKEALEKCIKDGVASLPVKNTTRGPLPVVVPEPYASLIKEWSSQKSFDELCKKYGVNRHTAHSYLYGKRKK